MPSHPPSSTAPIERKCRCPCLLRVAPCGPLFTRHPAHARSAKLPPSRRAACFACHCALLAASGTPCRRQLRLGALPPCAVAAPARSDITISAQHFGTAARSFPPRSAAEVRCGPRPALAATSQTTVCREPRVESRQHQRVNGSLQTVVFPHGVARRGPHLTRHTPTRVRRNCCRPVAPLADRLSLRSALLAASGAPCRQQLRLGALPALRRRCSHPVRSPCPARRHLAVMARVPSNHGHSHVAHIAMHGELVSARFARITCRPIKTCEAQMAGQLFTAADHVP